MTAKPTQPATPTMKLALLPLALAVALWTALNRSAASSQQIPRRHFWSANGQIAEDEIAKIVAASEPVILTSSPAINWPALELWSPKLLANRLTNLPPVDESESSTFEWSDRSRQMGSALGLHARRLHARVNVSSHDFFLGPRVDPSSSSSASTTFRQLHGRLSDYEELSPLSEDAQPRSWLYGRREDGRRPVDDATLWASEPDTVSHTHYDAATNLYVQVHGVKRWELWPPAQWRDMQLHPHAHPSHRTAAEGLEAARYCDMRAHTTPSSLSLHTHTHLALDSYASQASLIGIIHTMRDVLISHTAGRSQRDFDAGYASADTSATRPPAPLLVGEISPGDLLFVPAFHFHRVTSLTFSTALSALTPSEAATRFDRACRQGLPSSLTDRHAPQDARAASAQRYFSALLRALLPPAMAHAYVADALVHARYSPLGTALRCNDAFPTCDEHEQGEQRATQFGAARPEEQAIAVSVADVIRGGAGGKSSMALDGEGHIVLQDYIEHVAGYAVGMQALCSFARACL